MEKYFTSRQLFSVPEGHHGVLYKNETTSLSCRNRKNALKSQIPNILTLFGIHNASVYTIIRLLD